MALPGRCLHGLQSVTRTSEAGFLVRHREGIRGASGSLETSCPSLPPPAGSTQVRAPHAWRGQCPPPASALLTPLS